MTRLLCNCFIKGISEIMLIPLEVKLELQGKWRQAQTLRQIYHHLIFGPTYNWQMISDFIRSEKRLVFLAQKEEFFRECKKRYESMLKRDLDPDRDSVEGKLKEARESSSKAHQDLWYERQQRFRTLSAIPDGPLRRALLVRLQQRDFHLSSSWQRAQCAAMGGCCGRSCGCCSKPRNPDDDKKYHGHCFSYCMCCTDQRGFRIEPSNLEDDPMHTFFNFSQGRRLSEYECCLLDSYIWGLL
ncbi:hypothetical protein BO99DRAFT_403050 [Aspergillus violaceofuscus CBS 115571]|uniref:Uncharacterized protein n=1 Tax=Aspergillus violaceofuscus (strain CBS 115571) TaxID=1450538 RepID=A0A2V5I4K5_ASPV1|nr:hypothetical protein BO99DRAFT_403050 [Aspergillus violaceofuscus CBS 115571]